MIESYRQDIKNTEERLERLKNHPLLFENNKCHLCSGLLVLPIVAFLCEHSFHASCLGDNDSECPICAPEHDIVLDLYRSQKTDASRQEVFLRSVKAHLT